MSSVALSRQRTRLRPELSPVLLGRGLHIPLTPRVVPEVQTAKPGRIWPVIVLMVVALVCANLADVTAQAWPLGVLMALPGLALLIDCMGRPRVRPSQPARRVARIRADRRPVLLRSVVVVCPGRLPRIKGRRHDRLRLPPRYGQLRVSAGLVRPRRKARIVAARYRG